MVLFNWANILLALIFVWCGAGWVGVYWLLLFPTIRFWRFYGSFSSVFDCCVSPDSERQEISSENVDLVFTGNTRDSPIILFTDPVATVVKTITNPHFLSSNIVIVLQFWWEGKYPIFFVMGWWCVVVIFFDLPWWWLVLLYHGLIIHEGLP